MNGGPTANGVPQTAAINQTRLAGGAVRRTTSTATSQSRTSATTAARSTIPGTGSSASAPCVSCNPNQFTSGRVERSALTWPPATTTTTDTAKPAADSDSTGRSPT